VCIVLKKAADVGDVFGYIIVCMVIIVKLC
jgi:hypothetical protein